MQQDLNPENRFERNNHRSMKFGATDEVKKHAYEMSGPKAHRNMSPYRNLFWMGLLHVPIMYLVMFSMVDTRADVVHNLNTFYMAVMMAAPMVALMPFMMKEMYPDRKKNILAVSGALIILVGAFSAIRFQSAIGDSQFIRSMIPHHSGAILMCREAGISDPELSTLCQNISKAQREEIIQMDRILKRLK